MNTLRDLTLAEVEIKLEADYDYVPVRGNIMCSDDPDLDKAEEDEVLRRLECGDVWAWACVKVSASWCGFEGVDCLGGCTYASEEQFVKPGGDYDDMVREALADLNTQIKDSHEKTVRLVEARLGSTVQCKT